MRKFRSARTSLRLVIAVIALLAVFALSGCAQIRAKIAANQAAAARASVASADAGAESHVTASINALRAAHHMRTLSTSGNLTDKARNWARWMAAGNCGRSGGVAMICHSSLTSGIKVAWTWLAENVGSAAPRSNLNGVINGFTNSPGHLSNILSPRATSVGVGVAYAGNTVYVVEEFLQG